MSVTGAILNPGGLTYRHHLALSFRVRCSSRSEPRRGFGPKNDNAKKRVPSREQKDMYMQGRNSAGTPSPSMLDQAPGLSLNRISDNMPSDLQFEERLGAVKRSALQRKKAEKEKELGVIDYDAPLEQNKSTVGLGTKIGVGVAAVVFGLVFAFGDFLPSGSSSNEDGKLLSSKLSADERVTLEIRLQQYEATLSSSPKDISALEGAAVASAELGMLAKSASLLEDLVKEKPSDPEAFRLLGEVKYELQDYDASAAAYKISQKLLNTIDFDVLRGLTNSLLAAKKSDEAVQILLQTRDHLNTESLDYGDLKTDNNAPKVDPVQVELLLGKAYSDWGHLNDALSVYNELISGHPDDFRGFLAKGILLKQNGNAGDAERMFMQARFFAPSNAKALVDRYAKQ